MRAVIPSPASRAALALLAVVTSAAGCATKGDLRDLRTEMRGLAQRQDSLLAELRLQRALTADTLGRQTRQLSNLEGNVSQQLGTMAADIDRLMELAGQNSRDIAAIRDQMVRTGRTGARDPMAPPGIRPGGDPRGSAEADSLYEAGYDLYTRGSWTAARTAFERFLDRYPRDELAPRVHANLADVLAQQGLIEDAVAEYKVIPEEFPNDPEVPNALYRLGLLYIDLQDEDEARRYLRMVINTYPESQTADLAREVLDELGG